MVDRTGAQPDSRPVAWRHGGPSLLALGFSMACLAAMSLFLLPDTMAEGPVAPSSGPLGTAEVSGTTSPQREAAVQVHVVEPSPAAFVTGSAAIEARVDLAKGVTLARLQFEVNGQVVAVLTREPWRIMHDFGPGYEAWYIRVKAITASGATADATVTTRALSVNDSMKVDVVSLYATVRDGRGHYLMDLGEDDFLLLEDGRRQQFTSFSRERLPLALEIVLDTSKSMQGRSIEEARRAAVSFLDALEPADLVGIVEFNDRVIELHPLNLDRRAARQAIAKTQARGGTALYDAVARAAGQLKEVSDDRRLALILLSDGRDEAYSGMTPGSRLTFDESLARVIDSGVILYAIGLGEDPGSKLDFYGHHSLQEILQTLARQTGGQAFFTRKADHLGKTYQKIATELRHHYSLAYSSTNHKRDGAWRKIELRTRKTGLTVLTRKGYYAPEDDRFR